MLIQWSEKYCTGVPEIDSQHKEIINQLNKLHEAITSGLGKDVILDILEFAGNYAAKHFAYEEKCMDKYQCPVAQKNKQEHDKFIKRFNEIRDQITNTEVNSDAVLGVYRELREWIKSHILAIDTHLQGCVAKRREG